MLQLQGSSLTPWSMAKATQLMRVVNATLTAAGTPASPTDAVLVSVTTATTGGGRRLAATGTTTAAATPAAVAAIPSMYGQLQTAVVQVVATAPTGAAPALQRALVQAAASGLLAADLRMLGALHCGRSGGMRGGDLHALAGARCRRRTPVNPRLTPAAPCTPPVGLSVSQAAILGVYAGTADPPATLTPLTSTAPAPAPAPAPAAPSTSSGAPNIAAIAGIAGGAAAAVLLTGGRGRQGRCKALALRPACRG